MPREKLFPVGQILGVSPAEWPFIGPRGEKIFLVRVLESDGERMIVESAIEGVPIHVFSTVVVVLTPEEALRYKVALTIEKFTFTPVSVPAPTR